MKSNTSFIDWITKTGPQKIATTLGVYESAVRHWKDGRVLPQARHMKMIKKLTKGKIGYNDIIEGAQSPLKNL